MFFVDSSRFALAGPIFLAAQAHAQPALGVSFIKIDAKTPVSGPPDTESGLSVAINAVVTAHHGVQLDANLVGGEPGTIGRVGQHTCMTPHDRQKYGLYILGPDIDGRSGPWGSIAAERVFVVARHSVRPSHWPWRLYPERT